MAFQRLCLGLLIVLGSLICAETIRLNGKNTSYEVDRRGRLQTIRIQDTVLKLKDRGVVLKGPYGWLEENMGEWSRKASLQPTQLSHAGSATTMAVHDHGKELRISKLLRTSTDCDSLELACTISVHGDLFAEFTYLPLYDFDLGEDWEWLQLSSEIGNGKIIHRLRRFPQAHFLDVRTGKNRTIGNERLLWQSFPLVGLYHPKQKKGFFCLLKLPEHQDGTFMSGGAKKGFWTLRTTGLGPDRNGWSTRSASFIVKPFAGDPEQDGQQLLDEEWLKNCERMDLLPCRPATARALPAPAGLELWCELPSVKIFKSDLPPAEKQSAIHTMGARGEGVAVQLAVRAKRDAARALRLTASPLVNHAGDIISAAKISWHPLGFVRQDEAMRSTQLIGEMPDLLLEPLPVPCAKGLTQPFWIRIDIPPETKPGDYDGKLQLHDGRQKLTDIPFRLTVWNFTLPPSPTIVSLINIWPHRMTAAFPHDKNMQEKSTRQLRELVTDAGGAWICRKKPVPKWDNEGNLIALDTMAFDREAQEYFDITRAKWMFNSFARFGAGGEPFKKGLFGTREEIGSTVWKRRINGFFSAFRLHLSQKGWLDKVVLDVFDEPQKKWIPLLKLYLTEIRKSAPELKLTYPGHYHMDLDGLIDIWQMLLYPEPTMASPEAKRHFQATHARLAVYNPANFEEHSANAAMRGLYWWMWRMEIPSWMQWCTNIWTQADGYSGWNAFNNASWTAFAPTGIRSTLRMEMCRLGNTDHAYLTLLSQEHDRARQNGDSKTAMEAQKLMERARHLTDQNGTAPPALQDAETLQKIRDDIGRLLNRLAH